MDPKTIVYIIPTDMNFNHNEIPGHSFVYHENKLYVISDEELDYPTRKLSELTRELGYNPFETTGPLPESEKLMLEIASNLEYLICLADLGLLGGDF